MTKKKNASQAETPKTLAKLDIERWPPAKLKPYKRNAKNHPPEQIRMIASLIEKHGFDVPIVVDAKGTIIKGHGRWLAAKELGMETVPVLVRSDLTAVQAAEARIADNRVGEFGWDFEALVGDVVSNLGDGFDVALTGFSLKDLGLESGEVASIAVDSTAEGTASFDDGASEEGSTGEIDIGKGTHTCPRCSFTFG